MRNMAFGRWGHLEVGGVPLSVFSIARTFRIRPEDSRPAGWHRSQHAPVKLGSSAEARTILPLSSAAFTMLHGMRRCGGMLVDACSGLFPRECE